MASGRPGSAWSSMFLLVMPEAKMGQQASSDGFWLKGLHTDSSVAGDITDDVSALKEFRHRDSNPGRSGESQVS